MADFGVRARARAAIKVVALFTVVARRYYNKGENKRAPLTRALLAIK